MARVASRRSKGDGWSWYVKASVALVAAFVICLAVLITIFHRTRDIEFELFLDLTFLPLEVLLVSLIIDRLFSIRENREFQQKSNIAIAVFFSLAGNDLLRYFSLFDENLDEMREIVRVKPHWTTKDFTAMSKRLERHEYDIDCRCADLNDLKNLLRERREFLLGLLANASLLENSEFTQLLWAIVHLAQELNLRKDLNDLPQSDYDHIGEDMKRAYVQLVAEWLSYVRRLRDRQPFMLDLVIRVNPFAENPSPVVEGPEKSEAA